MDAVFSTLLKAVGVFVATYALLYVFSLTGAFHELTGLLAIALFAFVFLRIMGSKDAEGDGSAPSRPPAADHGREPAPERWPLDLRVLLNAQGDLETLREIAARSKGRFLARQIDDLADLIERLTDETRRRRIMTLAVRQILARDVAALAHRLAREFTPADRFESETVDAELGEQAADLAAQVAAILAAAQK